MKSTQTGKSLTVCRVLAAAAAVLLALIVIAAALLLFFEHHSFSNIDGLEKREFSCYRDGLEIRGTVFMPVGTAAAPAAIVCHEFMANRLFSYPYAMALARCGYAAFCFDFCGGGIISDSDGDSRDMSVLTEIEDLAAVMDFAAAQEYTTDQPILLMGCSQGGLVAALTAAQQQERLCGLILQYPALIIPDAARAGEMLGMSFDPENVPEVMYSGPMKIGRQYATDVMDIDVMEAISHYTGPVLILHGDRDTLVDLSSSQEAEKAYRAAGADVTLRVIPGGGHIFVRPQHIRQAIGYITGFAQELNQGI